MFTKKKFQIEIGVKVIFTLVTKRMSFTPLKVIFTVISHVVNSFIFYAKRKALFRVHSDNFEVQL